MNRCKIVGDLLPLYVDGLTSEDSGQFIEEHVAQCPACRALLEQMRAPLETEPSEEVADYAAALRKRRRCRIRRGILAAVLAVILCLAGIFAWLETHFTAYTPVVVSTDAELICGEMPELMLTAQETELAGILMQNPFIRAHMEDGQGFSLSTDLAQDLLRGAVPEDAGEVSLYTYGHWVTVDYISGDRRVLIEYGDPDGTGAVDLIRKTVGVLSSGKDQRVKEAYMLEYDVALEQTSYQKLDNHKIWFAWWDILTEQ